MQPELFPPAPLSIQPAAGLSTPRLWVRRLVIFGEPGKIVRDVALRPGLNIIWSPDPGVTSPDPMGHGGGKTMFCRLLRYCLGEDGFAPAGQRRRMWDKLPNGMVGAEVMVDGRCWAIVRTLGPRKHDRVVRDANDVGDALDAAEPTLSIADFRKALSALFSGDASHLMPESMGKDAAWQSALAWMTRDQECRFAHPLEWCDPDSDSHSPVRNLSKEDLLIIVRAFLGSLAPQELLARKQADELEADLASRRDERNGLQWQIKRNVRRFRTKFGESTITDSTVIEAAALKASAHELLQKALNLPAGSPLELSRARKVRDEARERHYGCRQELDRCETKIESSQRIAGIIRGELIEAAADFQAAGNPVCPICKIPIDTVLAAGCQISLENCDLDELRKRNEDRKSDLHSTEAELARLQNSRPCLNQEIAVAKQQLERSEQIVERLEHAIIERSDAVRDAERLIENITGYTEMLDENAAVDRMIEDAQMRLQAVRQEITDWRGQSALTVRALSERFGAVIRELVPGEVAGHITLDGNGLGLHVELGGDRSTAAIDSWKIVAFDFAALTMTIEGYTRLPAFLLHDSPREADLGISLYARLFAFARKLEAFGPTPLFQYVITTTTEPPQEFQSQPWLRLILHGAPAAERLLGMDL